MFLCILNPSCPFSCSAADPFWHFSGGIHEASCHWQTGTLQLQTKLKEGCFHSSLYLRVYRRSFGMSPFRVTGCSQPVILIILYICPCTDYVHILILTNIVIDPPKKSLNKKVLFSPLKSYKWKSTEVRCYAFILLETMCCFVDWWWSWLLLSYKNKEFCWNIHTTFQTAKWAYFVPKAEFFSDESIALKRLVWPFYFFLSEEIIADRILVL